MGRRLFVDSCQALAWLRAQGPALPPVHTAAPPVLWLEGDAVVPAASRLNRENIQAANFALVAVAEQFFADLNGGGADGLRRAEILSAIQYLLGEFQNHIFPAALLTDDDIGAGSQVLALTATGESGRRFRHGLAAILEAAGASEQVINTPAVVVDIPVDPAPPAPSFIRRLREAGPRVLLYRASEQLFARLKCAGPRGSILVWHENELAREVASELLLRGYALHRIRTPATGAADYQPQDFGEAVAKTLRRHLSPFFCSTALDALVMLARGGIATAQRRAGRVLPAWRALLAQAHDLRPRAILTNHIVQPEAFALGIAAREARIPLVYAQHGVTPEISHNNCAATDFLREEVDADLSLVFNHERAEIGRGNRYASGKIAVVGMPQDYLRHVDDRPGDNAAIWYVSTTLYQSNIGRMHRGMTDPEMAAMEIDFAENVLAKLPHPVVYKPYPARRFLDLDPIVTQLRKIANISVYGQRLDLRYELTRARALLTRGATSTISWCLMSGRPTVMIDSRYCMPLRPELREIFAAGLFLVDGDLEDAEQHVLALLRQPRELLEAAWQAKAAARALLIDRCFSTGKGGAGRRAADVVQALVDEYRSAL